MSSTCTISEERLGELKLFIDTCTKKPDILHLPELSFFKNYIESLGGKIPARTSMSSEEPKPKEAEKPKVEEVDSEPESDLELDMEGCVKPDTLDDNQKMGDADKEVSEEDMDKADEKRGAAMKEFSEGNAEKAIELFTEAIELNPRSALLLAKRGQAYLKLERPNACVRDCTRALELNPDSAAAYKFRGRAYRLLGEWEKAAVDLRQACRIDFDEQTDAWLREVTPNAQRIERHHQKAERKRAEKEERERAERARRAREAHERASAGARAGAEHAGTEGAEEDMPAGAGGPMPGMGDFYKLMQDPEIMAAFQDPEVAAAFQDISSNPANFMKYQSNPKIMALITKISGKVSGSGMNFPGFPGAGGMPGGFPGGGAGFPGGFPGFGGAGAGAGKPNPPKGPEDDNLD